MKAWNDNMYQFVCRCAEKAKEEKYNFFGVQNCGKFPKSRYAYEFCRWILGEEKKNKKATEPWSIASG